MVRDAIKDGFSVAISVYAKDKAIEFDRALNSITEKQTIKPTEIVLVCDGPISTELNTVIRKYCEQYPIFKIIRLSENKGLGNALRMAVEASSNELVARMDSDDISCPNRFEQQLEFFNHNPSIDIVGGDITEFIGEERNVIGKRTVPKNDNEIKQYMKKRAAFNHVTVMFKKQAVLNAGGYLDWFWNEDYYLWIRMQLKNMIFANTGTVLVNVRVSEDMYNRRGGLKYFRSEYCLQRYMYKNKIINMPEFIINNVKRVIVQVILPNNARAWVFKKLARDKVSESDRSF